MLVVIERSFIKIITGIKLGSVFKHVGIIQTGHIGRGNSHLLAAATAAKTTTSAAKATHASTKVLFIHIVKLA
ncbi:hypothetical protein D9M68_651430 [compost metagenome]